MSTCDNSILFYVSSGLGDDDHTTGPVGQTKDTTERLRLRFKNLHRILGFIQLLVDW